MSDLDDAVIEGPIMGPLIILEEQLKGHGAPEWMHKVAKRAQFVVEDQGEEIERLRAALGEIGALTAEPKLYDHEEAMSDRLDAIYKHVKEALND